jgi:hypothetical protein
MANDKNNNNPFAQAILSPPTPATPPTPPPAIPPTDNVVQLTGVKAELATARAAARAARLGTTTPSPTNIPNLPSIVEDPENYIATIDQTIEALRRGGRVCRRSRNLVIADRSAIRMTRYGNKPVLTVTLMNKSSVEKELVRCAAFFQAKQGKIGRIEVPHLPSPNLCNILLHYVDDKPMNLPILKGVTAAPFLRFDGSICQTPGYDAATGVWFDPCGTVFPPIPTITPENALDLARQAAWRLLRPLRGYRFATTTHDPTREWGFTDTNRTVALSSFLTIVAVHATRTRPGYISDATIFGSGKTMLAELPAIMTTGDDPALIPMTDGDDTEEFNKQLDTALLGGRGYIIFDNAEGDIARFTRLKALQTSGRLSVRLFKTQSDTEIDNTFMVSISGNQLESSGDSARRNLRARIDTQEENPEQKHFDFDPRDEVRQHRAQMCIDALTILSAHRIAGAPAQGGRSWGSFEEWTRVVRDPLMWLGFRDIATSNDEARQSDQNADQLRSILNGWQAARLTGQWRLESLINEVEGENAFQAAGGMKATYAASIAKTQAMAHCEDLREALLEVAQDKSGRGISRGISKERLGKWLGKMRDRWVANRCIHRSTSSGSSNNQYELLVR